MQIATLQRHGEIVGLGYFVGVFGGGFTDAYVDVSGDHNI
jgi:hypothetical protein